MRFLLTNLLFEPVIASSTIGRYIDELIDPFSEFHSDEHKTVDVFGTNRAHIIKTHMSYRRGMPLRERTIGAIYVMRNPLDVAVSIGRYSTAETEKTISDFELRHDPRDAVVRWGVPAQPCFQLDGISPNRAFDSRIPCEV